MTLFIYIEWDLSLCYNYLCAYLFCFIMATKSHTSKASSTGTPKRSGGVDTIPTCTSTGKVARWRLQAAQENLSDPEGNHLSPMLLTMELWKLG